MLEAAVSSDLAAGVLWATVKRRCVLRELRVRRKAPRMEKRSLTCFWKDWPCCHMGLAYDPRFTFPPRLRPAEGRADLTESSGTFLGTPPPGRGSMALPTQNFLSEFSSSPCLTS